MYVKKIIITLVLFISFTNLSFSQTKTEQTPADIEYTKTLKKMFEVAGSEETYKAAIKQMVSMFKTSYTGLEDKFWDELEKEFLKSSMEDLTTMLVPVYKKHMSLADLKEIIVFYESPVGKKYAKEVPAISVESMEVGQKWGAKIGQEIAERLAKEEK